MDDTDKQAAIGMTVRGYRRTPIVSWMKDNAEGKSVLPEAYARRTIVEEEQRLDEVNEMPRRPGASEACGRRVKGRRRTV
jgi:hypothetical protein